MKAGRLALRGQLGGDLSEFAQKPWENCVLMSIKSDRPARDTPMSPAVLCPKAIGSYASRSPIRSRIHGAAGAILTGSSSGESKIRGSTPAPHERQGSRDPLRHDPGARKPVFGEEHAKPFERCS
jgi:hypothetical protein